MIVNGRFQHAEPGGFRRYAVEVSSRLDEALIVAPRPRFARGAVGKIWEQTLLARRARRELLWSPATSGPIRHQRHVVTLHDVAPLIDPEGLSRRARWANRALLPTLAKSASMVVVDSEAMLAEVKQRFLVDPARIVVAEPGIDDRFRAAAEVERVEARRLLGLGSYGIDVTAPLIGGLVSSIPRKRANDVLATLETAVAAGAASAVVAGWNGPQRVFGVSDRPTSRFVDDLGCLSDEDFARFYRALDVFVWLPRHEGFGLPVVEAAAAGTPVVCSAIPSAVEHLAPDVAIVESVSEAVAAVGDLLANRDHANEVAERAQRNVAHLTWDATAAAVNGAINKLRGTS